MKTETQIALSDKRLAAAVAVLNHSDRGRTVLAEFRGFATGQAAGLDAPGMVALVTIVTEFAQGRRDFIDIADVAAKLAAEAAGWYLVRHQLTADSDALFTCIRANVKLRLPEAFRDAKEALDRNMGQVADMTFAATMRLAGVEAAKEAGYPIKRDPEIVGYELPVEALLAAAQPDTREL